MEGAKSLKTSRQCGMKAIFVVLLSLLETSCQERSTWETVSGSRKEEGRLGAGDFGYRIERRTDGKDAFRVTIDSQRMYLRVEALGFRLLSVVDQEWMCGERVIYLYIAAEYRDSGIPADGTTKLVYDFERGELASYSPSHTWTTWPRDPKSPRTLTESDFQSQLLRIKTSCSARSNK